MNRATRDIKGIITGLPMNIAVNKDWHFVVHVKRNMRAN